MTNLPCSECTQPCCRLVGTNHGWRALGTGCGVTKDGECEHLDGGKCAIYGRHPANCQAFRCDTDVLFRKRHPEVDALLKAKGL